MISNLWRESRKYGISLVGIDQTPSEIPNSIFANMNVKVSFSLGTQRDIGAMAKAMNIESWKAKYLGMLDTGQAIINVKQRYHEPFLLRAPFVKPGVQITDEELRDVMRKFSAQTEAEHAHDLQSPTSQTPQVIDTSPLDPLEKVVLASIIERPLDGVEKRTKRLGFHPSQMVRLHDSLENKRFIRSVYIDRHKLFEITEEGKEAAEKAKIPISTKSARGGLEHDYWIQKIYTHLRNLGFDAKFEAGGIDITAGDLAIEIETGKSDIMTNLEKLENSSFPHCYMLPTSKKAEIKIKKISAEYPSIKVLYVKDFLKLTTKSEICC
jgi:DNA-binding MarR family transcriptional regulator